MRKLRRARLDLVRDFLGDLDIEGFKSVDLVNQLEQLEKTITNPRLVVPDIQHYGDNKSRKVIEALLDKPHVLYGVLGILHNFKVAGPWQRVKNNQSKSVWHRRDARLGGTVMKVTRRQDNTCEWGPWQDHAHARADDMAAAMHAADEYLADKEWVLVPGTPGAGE